MMITTDIILPFIPRAAQPKQPAPKLNITRVKKEEKAENSLDNQNDKRDLSQWLLNHHKPANSEEEQNEQNKADGEPKTKHIDILA